MLRLDVPRLGLASFRRRILFRGVFLMLVLATLALAVGLLQEEKERSYRNYQENFRKTQAEIVARLRHPAGLLALLNPRAPGGTDSATAGNATPLRPLVLPYAALDFDDQNKAQQAIEMAGCSVRYPDGGSICVAIGSNPYSGGFLYLVGGFDSGELVPRERGSLALEAVHRASVTVTLRGEVTQWIAPFESMSAPLERAVRGRLTGFAVAGVGASSELEAGARPVRDFRGWLWQGGPCLDGSEAPDCRKRAFFSIRLPVESFREALFNKPRPVWPPADLDQMQVRVQMLAPGGAPLFDSNSPGAVLPPSLTDLRQTLLPGETLQITRQGGRPNEAITLRGVQDTGEVSSPWLTRLIRRLPVDTPLAPLSARDIITTPAGSYEVRLGGDVRGIEQALSVVATRVSWFVGAMLAAIGLAWLLIEVGLIRRITVLTRRAAAVSYNVQDARVDKRIGDLDVSDLRGNDELGILAGGLSDLLQRVKDDVRREHIRAQQERDMWHAVGHEIMSPLQSLMVLHGQPGDASHRYVQRMQQAVRVLYSQASPSEALEAAALQVGAIDVDAFLHHVAENARFAGIDGVRYERANERTLAPVMVRADEFSLEDAVTHILRNAARYRPEGTPITLSLDATDSGAVITIHNQGPAIDAALLEKIFEYGVSDAAQAGEESVGEHRGQGLFVAKTYMAKMGGTVSARNESDGVSFVLTLGIYSIP